MDRMAHRSSAARQGPENSSRLLGQVAEPEVTVADSSALDSPFAKGWPGGINGQLGSPFDEGPPGTSRAASYALILPTPAHRRRVLLPISAPAERPATMTDVRRYLAAGTAAAPARDAV